MRNESNERVIAMDFYDSIFYADLRRAMRLHILKTAGSTVIAAAVYFFFSVFIYVFLNFLNMQWIYWTFSAALVVLFICREMHIGFKKRDKLIFQFSEMNGEKLAETEEKYYAMNPEFDTFFFLDEYVYFPDHMLLIPYDDVADVKSEFPSIKVMHIPISLGAILKIRCVYGAKYSVRIRKSHEFRDYHMTIASSIASRQKKHTQTVREYEPLDKSISENAADLTCSETAEMLCGRAFRHKILKTVGLDMGLFFAYWVITCFVLILWEAWYAQFIAVSAAADIILLIVLLIRLSAKREEMIQRTDKFSAADFEAVKQGRAMFGTFFMLEDCIWFFWENTALDYDSILNVTSAYHFSSSIPDGIRLEFRLKSGKKCRIYVKKWFEYKAYEKTFLNDLNEKINKNNFQEVLK